MLDIVPLLAADRFADARNLADAISKAATALAVVASGIWAYFKFAKGRTFRPRIQVEVTGSMQDVNGRRLFHVRTAVKNIGSSKVELIQYGSGLRVCVAVDEPSTSPGLVRWSELSIYPFMVEHEWIEPSETISDDIVLDLGQVGPSAVLCEARLVWRRSLRKNIVVFARKVVLPTPIQKDDNVGTNNETEKRQ